MKQEQPMKLYDIHEKKQIRFIIFYVPISGCAPVLDSPALLPRQVLCPALK
jgi:hypothetical protein